jgi:hypothetical protein
MPTMTLTRAPHRTVAALLLALALLLGGAHLAAAQANGFAATPTFGAGGQAAAVFLGGAVDDLEAAARTSGANGVWAQDGEGRFQLLVVGGPAFLRDGFAERFPGGFASAVAVTLTRPPGTSGPPPPVVTSTPTTSTPGPRPTAFPGGVPGPSANQ